MHCTNTDLINCGREEPNDMEGINNMGSIIKISVGNCAISIIHIGDNEFNFPAFDGINFRKIVTEIGDLPVTDNIDNFFTIEIIENTNKLLILIFEKRISSIQSTSGSGRRGTNLTFSSKICITRAVVMPYRFPIAANVISLVKSL